MGTHGRISAASMIVQGWPWNTLVATRLSIAAPRRDGSLYENEALQFLRLRWGKVVEDRLYEDTYKLFIEGQKRLGDEEIGEGERQSWDFHRHCGIVSFSTVPSENVGSKEVQL